MSLSQLPAPILGTGGLFHIVDPATWSTRPLAGLPALPLAYAVYSHIAVLESLFIINFH